MRPAFRHGRAGLLVCFLLCPAGASGQEIVVGWEGQSGRGYAFVAPGGELASRDRHRLILRVVGSYLYYDYPEDDAMTEVRSPGAALVLGYRIATPRVSFTISPGVEVRRTTRQRAADSATAREVGGTLQAELFGQLSARVHGSMIASYGHANRYTWARGALRHQLSNFSGTGRVTLSAGVEATKQGNPDTQSTQIGGVLEIAVPRSAFSGQVRGGLADDKARHPYIGIGVYRRF